MLQEKAREEKSLFSTGRIKLSIFICIFVLPIKGSMTLFEKQLNASYFRRRLFGYGRNKDKKDSMEEVNVINRRLVGM